MFLFYFFSNNIDASNSFKKLKLNLHFYFILNLLHFNKKLLLSSLKSITTWIIFFQVVINLINIGILILYKKGKIYCNNLKYRNTHTLDNIARRKVQSANLMLFFFKLFITYLFKNNIKEKKNFFFDKWKFSLNFLLHLNLIFTKSSRKV